jgi:hypothetical protein
MSSTPTSTNLLPQRKFEDYFPSEPKPDASKKPTQVVSKAPVFVGRVPQFSQPIPVVSHRPYIAPVFVGHVGHIGRVPQFSQPILVTKDGHVLVCQNGTSPYAHDPFVRMAPPLVRF